MAKTVKLKCANCGETHNVELQTRGSMKTEILLWVFTCGTVGLIYSIWRLMGKVAVCPNCNKPTPW